MKKDKNLTNLLYKWAQNGPKLRTFSKNWSGQAHPIFTGSYIKIKCI